MCRFALCDYLVKAKRVTHEVRPPPGRKKKVHARGNEAQRPRLSIRPLQSASLYMQRGPDALDRGSRSTETEKKMRERDVHMYGYANVHYIHSSILLSHF